MNQPFPFEIDPITGQVKIPGQATSVFHNMIQPPIVPSTVPYGPAQQPAPYAPTLPGMVPGMQMPPGVAGMFPNTMPGNIPIPGGGPQQPIMPPPAQMGPGPGTRVPPGAAQTSAAPPIQAPNSPLPTLNVTPPPPVVPANPTTLPQAMQTPSPPTSPEHKAERVNKWDEFLDNFNKPNMQSAMLQLGLSLLQPTPAGQTDLGHLSTAMQSAMAGHAARQSQEEARQMEQKKYGLEERKTAATEEQAKAATTRAGAATTTAEATSKYYGDKIIQGNAELAAKKAKIEVEKKKLTLEQQKQKSLEALQQAQAKLAEEGANLKKVQAKAGGFAPKSGSSTKYNTPEEYEQALYKAAIDEYGWMDEEEKTAFDKDVKRIVKSTFPEGTAPSTGRQGSFADAIAKLRANPELAPQFDERYGKGMAQRYLGAQ